MKNFAWLTMMMFSSAVFFSAAARAQSGKPGVAVEHHTVDWQGGPILNIYQDQYGYLWLGALGGAARFDGYRYDYFFHDDGAGLPREAVFNFAETPDGKLWAAGSNYLSRYDRTKNRFEEIFYYPAKTHDKSFGLFPDKEGYLWTDIFDGLSRVSPDSLTETRYRLYHPEYPGLEKALSCGLISRKGEFWFGTFTGRLFLSDSIAGTTLFLREITLPGRYRQKNITPLFELSDGTIWAGCEHGIFVVLPGSTHGHNFNWIDELNPSSSRAENVTGLSLEKNGKIWATTHQHLFIINLSDSTYTRLDQDNCNPNALRETNIHSLMIGRNGIAWMGTNIGFTKAARIQSPFGFLHYDPAGLNGLEKGAIYSLAEGPDGTLWAGGVSGLYHLSEGLKASGHYLDGKSPNPEASFDVRCILPGDDGSIWVGTFRNGLGRFSPDENVFAPIEIAPPGGAQTLATNLLYRVATRCRDGRIWFGRMNGVSVFSPFTQSFRHYTLANANKDIEQQQVFTIVEDSDGGIWAGGTTKRLHYFHPETDSLETIAYPELRHNIFTIHEQKGTPYLWIGGQGDGLHQFDRKKKELFRSFSLSDGLPSNVVYGILQDGHQNLWLSTSNGLARFNIEDQSFRSFNEVNGQPLRDFSSGAYLRASDGRLLFGGEGIVYFHPDSISPHSQPSSMPLLITGIDILGREEHWEKPPEELEKITLQPEENYLSISFICLDHTFPSDIKYRYCLEKAGQKEENWSPPQSQPLARFHNLAPGAYLFRLQSTDGKGRWLSPERRLAITIKPHFWQTSLFMIIVAVLIIGGITGGVSYYLRSRARKQRRELEMKAHQASFSALMSQLNPHFLFNALNSGNRFIAEKDVYSANKFLTRFAGLMRLYLENSRKPFISLQEEAEALKLYLELEHLRFGDKFDYEIKTSSDIDAENIRVPAMLAFPFVENAIKHGLRHKKGKGFLLVEFRKTEESVRIEVTDNGIGRARAATLRRKGRYEKTSTGIANVMERIQLIKAMYGWQVKAEISDLYPEETAETGTRVVINIPITKHQNAYEDHRRNR